MVDAIFSGEEFVAESDGADLLKIRGSDTEEPICGGISKTVGPRAGIRSGGNDQICCKNEDIVGSEKKPTKSGIKCSAYERDGYRYTAYAHPLY